MSRSRRNQCTNIRFDAGNAHAGHLLQRLPDKPVAG
jgi:hypothetical protein